MKTIKGVAFAIIILVLASMFTSCETIAQGIIDGVNQGLEDWKNNNY
jgi:lipoprotein